MRIKQEVIDELLKDYKKPEDVLGENGLLKRLTKALLERALNAEMTHHLGYEKHEPGPKRGNAPRQEPQDGKGRVWGDGGGDATGPEGDVRAADSAQTSTAIQRIRRTDS